MNRYRNRIEIKKLLKTKRSIKENISKENSIAKISKIFIIFIFILFNIIILLFLRKKKQTQKFKYIQDDVTLVTAYYKIKSKHTPEEYLKRLNNFVLLNRSMVFFSNKEFMPIIKELRPKEYHNKTIFIELEMEDFYVYKNYYQDFEASFKIDPENRYHTVPLYLVWAEKCTFMKKAIEANYFNSKCFYWIDAGYFCGDKSEMEKYVSINWPKSDKCLTDERIVMGQVKKYSEEEKKLVANFNLDAIHRLVTSANVAGGFFGGQINNTLKFVNYYYDAIRLFIKNKIFIGKDQYLFAYIAFCHPEVVELIFFNDYMGFKTYLQ